VIPRDVCARRHRGNPQSRAANVRVHRAKYECRAAVYAWILEQGSAGATCEEVSRALGMRYTTTSGRISELKADGWLVPAGKTRKTSTGATAGVHRAVSAAERDQRSQLSLPLNQG